MPNELGNIRLAAEYRWPDHSLEAEAVFSALVEYDFSPTIGAQIGSTNADPLGFGAGDRTWFVNVGYHFGLGR